MEELYLKFDDYVSNFDMNNEMIKLKYDHTYRVVEYAKKIAKSESLNEEDYNIAIKCALLHDIARFKQVKEYNTFYDALSFDHGDEGYNILLNDDYIDKYTSNNEEKNIILKSVKNHNKMRIEEGLTEKELYFSKLVRDADKLDIMFTQAKVITDGSNTINPILFESLKTKTQVLNKYVTNDCERLFRMLCFIFDFNFNESFNIVKQEDLVNKKLEIIKNIDIDINKIKDTLNKYIDERIDEYARN